MSFMKVKRELVANSGCTKRKMKTTHQYIVEAQLIHGDAYDYSKTVYLGSNRKVTIVCPIHGEFEQLATGHIQGKGCKWCAGKGKITKDMFWETVKQIHKDRYDYQASTYKDMKSDISIICREHGEFTQNARAHYRGQGCPKCGIMKVANSTRLTTAQFIEKAIAIHGSKYGYSKVKYDTAETPVTITCKFHGDFQQDPHSHIKGSGCKLCWKEKQINLAKERQTGWSYSDWEAAGKLSKNFNAFSLYVIKCTNQNESFIKIGKTFTTIEERFSSNIAMPYTMEVLRHYKHDNAYAVSTIEDKTKVLFKEYQYLPKIDFAGKYECMKDAVISELLKYLDDKFKLGKEG